MSRIGQMVLATFTALTLMSCAINQEVTDLYTINSYAAKKYHHSHKLSSIYISLPEAVSALTTDQMYYTTIPYETHAFVHHSWSSAPTDMMYPLILQSITDTGAFRVVAAGSHSETFTYRLSIEMLKLIQNFSTKPSRLQMTVSAILTDSVTGRPIASKLFRYNIPCPVDKPYGGAVAANRAAAQFTYALSEFAVTEISRHKQQTQAAH
jgi:cholesterol transport system auxiliary component